MDKPIPTRHAISAKKNNKANSSRFDDIFRFDFSITQNIYKKTNNYKFISIINKINNYFSHSLIVKIKEK